MLDSGLDRWLAATTRGLMVSTDEGCSWQGVEPFASTPTSALTRHPDEPAHLYARAHACTPCGARCEATSLTPRAPGQLG